METKIFKPRAQASERAFRRAILQGGPDETPLTVILSVLLELSSRRPGSHPSVLGERIGEKYVLIRKYKNTRSCICESGLKRASSSALATRVEHKLCPLHEQLSKRVGIQLSAAPNLISSHKGSVLFKFDTSGSSSRGDASSNLFSGCTSWAGDHGASSCWCSHLSGQF